MRLKVKDVTDGLSHTIALGEGLPELYGYGFDNAFQRWGNQPVSTVIPINPGILPINTDSCGTNGDNIRFNWGFQPASSRVMTVGQTSRSGMGR